MNENTYRILRTVAEIHALQLMETFQEVGEVTVTLTPSGVRCFINIIDPEAASEVEKKLTLNITWKELSELLPK
jgi:hypothetical protein